MLKALELSGFKSFADRTRFDFPDGITVIVGPNGSGKSNIVDAMKWVLGTQSPKSLRGQDMSDVIFKGSADRKPAAAAEATIVFDNRAHHLPIDAEEVHLTRRVYRSGESEYLINGTPCRLKDVRDLLRGTGVGVDAYSLIEQGKVDRMLQASAKDRRVIFEEAAGISRFRAKKAESERRLIRVEQNLVRLSDIVDEVAGRLENLRNQASKAERYRKQSLRIRELRTTLAWTDWLDLSNQFDKLQQTLRSTKVIHTTAEQQHAEALEQRQQWELQLQGVATQAQKIEGCQNDAFRQIAASLGGRQSDADSIRQLEESLIRRRIRLLAFQAQAGSTGEKLRDLTEKLEVARLAATTRAAETSRAETAHQVASKELSDAQSAVRHAEQELAKQTRSSTEWESRLARLRGDVLSAQRAATALAERVESALAAQSAATRQADEYRAALDAVDDEISRLTVDLEASEVELAEQRRLTARRRDEASALQGRLHGVNERLIVLEELEKRREGVTAGVKQVLQLARKKPDAIYRDVIGLAAELIEADVHLAPLIDVALGPQAQYLVVRGKSFSEAVASGKIDLHGRIGLLRLDGLPRHRPGDRIRLDGLQGVMGRADKMVRTESLTTDLVKHLLGTTWLVDTLDSALRLSRLCGAGLRFVTAKCELLERDGSMILGPAGTAVGLVSRRSELTASRQEQEHYRYQLTETEAELQRLIVVVDQSEAVFQQVSQAHRQSVTKRAAAEARLAAAIDRLNSIREDVTQLEKQHRLALDEAATSESYIGEAERELSTARDAASGAEQARSQWRATADAAQTAVANAADVVMRSGMEKSRAEQRFESLEATNSQLRRDQAERRQAANDVRAEIKTEQQRVADCSLRILKCSTNLAEHFLTIEACGAELRSLASELGKLRARQRGAQKVVDKAGAAANAAAKAMHEAEHALETAGVRKQTLRERIGEDYGLDLNAESPPENFQPPADRAAMEAEIVKLREAVQSTGSVNMEALKELEDLQSRYDTIHGQYQDLTSAKQSLERVIAKINVDSRRLFLETLEVIRQNFQRLYRKSFGGGSADLVLEESEDPLEAGVEIIATPPGKSSFSNTLLSGGEKALTAVALLMAIFEYRPSPFCVLDEVDAPFDEANIGRFVTVLNEFLDRTKFVIVTHSKKTMTSATTLYGVTMQESGISTKVAIKFEEVDEKGEPKRRAA